MSLTEAQRLAIRRTACQELASLAEKNDPFKHRELPEGIPDELQGEADEHFFECVEDLRKALLSQGHDPVLDEKKDISLTEFASRAQKEIGDYAEVWRVGNDFHKGAHTWEEWMRSFLQYMSW